MIKNIEQIDFLKDEELLKKMRNEYDIALDYLYNATNNCTVIEYMCNKLIKEKEGCIHAILVLLRQHSLCVRYGDKIEELLGYFKENECKKFKFDFFVGKDFIKTLHKIDGIYKSIIMELQAIKPLVKNDVILNYLEAYLAIKNLIIIYYVDNDSFPPQWH